MIDDRGRAGTPFRAGLDAQHGGIVANGEVFGALEQPDVMIDAVIVTKAGRTAIGLGHLAGNRKEVDLADTVGLSGMRGR